VKDRQREGRKEKEGGKRKKVERVKGGKRDREEKYYLE